MNTHDNASLAQSLRIRQSSTVASLVVLLYEWVVMSRKEFHCIWRQPFKSNQAVYLFSRYVGLAVQGVNVYLVLGPYANLSISEGRCKKWQLFQVLAAYGLTGALHLVLMLMVYALHLKDIRIGVYLMVLYFAQLALQGYVTRNAVMHITYDSICDTKEVHQDVVYLGISTWMTYISLVALVAVKRNLMSLGAPVVKRVMMDGGVSLMLLFSTSIAMVCYSLARQVAQAHVIFGWPNTITSIVCCRIIMNMETLDYADCQSGSEEDRTVGFNSIDALQLAQLEFERRAQIALAAETTQPA